MIILGIGLLFYPWISNYLFERNSNSSISTYDKKVKDLSKDEYDSLLADAKEYNKDLVKSKVVLTDPFDDKQIPSFSYSHLLNISGNGIMGYIEIPSISVKLPIYHGTSQDVLEKGIGHLGNSSLPIGGKSTHSILTGHTGLSNARLFTDLTELKINDLFFITVLDKKIAYKVDNISVVLPEDTAKLKIQKGKDYVTLVTCTPYGINSHRLLVRGIRTNYSEQDYKNIKKHKTNTHWFETYKKAIGISLLIIFVIIFITVTRRIIKSMKKKRKSNAKKM